MLYLAETREQDDQRQAGSSIGPPNLGQFIADILRFIRSALGGNWGPHSAVLRLITQ